MFVYKITNSITNKIYIGQHKGTNLQKYLHQKISHAKRGESSGSILYRSIRKHGREAFSIEPVATVSASPHSKAVLDSVEVFCIQFFDSRNHEKGYNICKGGEGFTGPHSEKTKKLVSENSKKMWANPDIRAKMLAKLEVTIDGQRGVPKSPEVCAAIQEAMQCPQVREHQSVAAKQRFAENRGNLFDPATVEASRLARQTPEFRAKVSEQMRREFAAGIRTVPAKNPEVAAKISATLTGKPLSDSHKASITESLKEQWASGKRVAPLSRPEVRLKVVHAWHIKKGIKMPDCPLCQ